MSDRPTILFDGNCHFCRYLAAWLEHHSSQNWKFRDHSHAPKPFCKSSQLGVELCSGIGKQIRFATRREEGEQRSWHQANEQRSRPINAVRKPDLFAYTSIWGQDAWAYLISHEPKLAAVRWLGQKLGYEQQIAGLAQKLGHSFRKICRKCPD